MSGHDFSIAHLTSPLSSHWVPETESLYCILNRCTYNSCTVYTAYYTIASFRSFQWIMQLIENGPNSKMLYWFATIARQCRTRSDQWYFHYDFFNASVFLVNCANKSLKAATQFSNPTAEAIKVYMLFCSWVGTRNTFFIDCISGLCFTACCRCFSIFPKGCWFPEIIITEVKNLCIWFVLEALSAHAHKECRDAFFWGDWHQYYSFDFRE